MSVTEKQLICVQSRVLNLYGVYLVNFSLLVVFIFIYFLNACLCFAIDLSFWKNMEVLVSFSPFAPFSVLALFVPGQFWDYLCPGIWDHLCPRSWNHLCPVFMELRVNSRCHLRIVCVYLTCFLNLRLRDNLCPLPDSGLSVPSIYGVACWIDNVD